MKDLISTQIVVDNNKAELMIVDIYIKSFNRPYYLERCIRSIYHYAQGSFRIKILDDGTPPEYLNAISKKFPDVLIFKSPLSLKKCRAIKEHIVGKDIYKQFEIPTNFWIEHIKNATDYFLLLEDDIWLTGNLSFSNITNVMREEQIVKLKISWQGASNINQGKISYLKHDIEEIKPRITFLNEVMLNNNFKLGSLLSYTKLVNFKALLPFYSIYSVASAFFSKEYWVYLWSDAGTVVDENFQLKKAYTWYKSSNSRYGKLKQEKAKTSYISSATGNFNNIKFDMLCFNHYLNEAWLKDGLDVMENFPKDFNINYIKPILEGAKDEKCRFENWLLWVSRFKKQYENLGCDVA